MVRQFSNPFGWDWMPRGESIYDISTGDTWGFSNSWAPFYDKWEELKKTTKTFEEIKKVIIHLTFDKDPIAEAAEYSTNRKKKNRYGFRHNQLTSIGKEFYLNINPTNEKYLTNEAKVEHNVSHILYDTPLRESRLQAHRLSLGSGIPDKLKDEKFAVSPDCNLCEDVIRHTFDILEDARVNSLWGELYLGTQIDYEKCQKKVSKELKGKAKNPLEALWYAYNGKTDDSEMSQIAAEFIAQIRGLDYPGGLLMQKKYFQHVILPWLKSLNFDQSEQKNDQKSKNNKDDQKEKKSKKKSNSKDQPSIEDLIKALQKTIKDVRQKHDAFPDHRGLQIELNGKKRKQIEKILAADDKFNLKALQGIPSNMKGTGSACKSPLRKNGKGQGTKGDPVGEFAYEPGTGGGNGKSYDMFDPKVLEKLRGRARERNNKIRNALVSKGLMRDSTLDAFNFDPEVFDIITREITSYPYRVDINTVQRLKRVWARAKGSSREIIDEEGEEIDLDSYIQEIPSVYKDNNIFVSSRDEPGLHIVYSADCSGSMDGTPLQLLRDVTATIKRSLEDEPKIKMSMIGWGGGHKTGISVHTTMDDINRFTVKDHYGGTPESNALWYSSTWLQRQPEISKAIFFVSDGAFSVSGAKEQVEIARANRLHVFGIGICDEGMDQQYRQIFGPGNYSIIDEGSYKSGLNKLISDIATFISCHIKTVA